MTALELLDYLSVLPLERLAELNVRLETLTENVPLITIKSEPQTQTLWLVYK